RVLQWADGESVSGPHRKRGRGSVWIGDETETACAYHHSRTAASRRSAVRRGDREGDRKGAERVKDRYYAAGRWEDHPITRPRAFRGASEGSGEIIAADGGGGAGPRSRKSAYCGG